jgi:phage gp36-like protein
VAYSTPAMVRRVAAPDASSGAQTTDTETAADLGDEVLADAIGEADAMIDAYLGARYALPIDLANNPTAPAPICYWSRDLALYLATLLQRGGMDFADTDPVARRYNGVMAQLNGVKDGSVVLQLLPVTTSNASAGAGAPLNRYEGRLWDASNFELEGADFPFERPNVWRGHWLSPWNMP